MAKELAPIEALDAKHGRESEDRRLKIEAAHKELRDAQTRVMEIKSRIAQLQQQHTGASFAYDAARLELLRPQQAA